MYTERDKAMEANLNQFREYYPKGSYQVSICKDNMGDLQGKTFFPGSEATQVFTSAWQMVKQIETNIIQNNFPENTFELRRWSKKVETKKPKEEEMPKEKYKFDKVLCTFLIQIHYCQNATWQGVILWLEKRQTKTFRSQFEMLKLMEEATEINIK